MAFTVQPPSVVMPNGGHDYDTYVSALEDVIARQLVDCEDALTVNTTTTPTVLPTEIMAAKKKEMTAMMATMAASSNGGAAGGSGTGNGTGGGKCKGRVKRDYENMPECPHCTKKAMHKPEDCFSLPANADKMKKANFVDGRFVKKVEE